MLHKLLIFAAAVLLSLTAGRAFWVTLGESPLSVRGATYVEFFQQTDRRVAVPIAMTGVGGTVLAGLSAAMWRRRRRACLLLVAACALGAIGSLVTALVNVPINLEIATWNPAALPSGYEALLRRWWDWHQVRMVAMVAASWLVYAAMLSAPEQG